VEFQSVFLPQILSFYGAYVHPQEWIVYDTDDFPADHINRTAELCKKTEEDTTQFHAIWSNQCIELWFLLHFGFYHSDIHRSEYWPKLTEWLSYIGKGEYKKNRADMYSVLRPYLNDAIENAKKLEKLNEGKTPSAFIHSPESR